MSTPTITSLAARIGGVDPVKPGSGAAGAASESSGSFMDALKGLIENTDQSADQANAAVDGMLNKTVDVHDAMIALQRAEMTLQLTVQIRNKLVQAYQDIMRMPV
ncbi:MAG TPA: flagellar hook-basal body complex protein FliE [Vicinamibacterales bacterium]